MDLIPPGTVTPWPTWALAWWTAFVLAAGIGAVADHQNGDESRRALARAAVTAAEPTSTGDAAPAVVSVPVSVEAPAVGLSAEVVPVGKAHDGSLELPAFGTAGWYERSARPGAAGSAVLVGHVDSYDGPDVFYALKDLQPGDEVRIVRSDGTAVTYVVERQEQVDKDELPVDRIFDWPSEPALRLVTCGGEFDRKAKSYESNIIVYGRLALEPTG